MLKQFYEYISRRELVADTDKVLLAVSGGIDSMTMVDLFMQTNYKIAIAHCNFSLRGAESDAEQALVEQVAHENNIPIFIKRFDTKKEATDSGESIQMAARRLRYDWFDELSRNEGFDKIAIAHHANDSIETFFINLLRGTGLRGVTGISTANGKIIRPLLFADRDQITTYVAERAVRFLNDSSNGEIKYLRNRLRHDILPRLADSTSNFTATMTDNLTRLEQAQRFVDNQIERIRTLAVTDDIIDLRIVRGEGDVKFVLFELLYRYGFVPDVIEDLYRSMSSSGKSFLSPHYTALIDRERIIIRKRERQEIIEESVDEDDTRIEWVDISRLMSLETPSNVALLCVDAVTFPLTIRRWRVGDWFIPLGMHGQKKVSDYLIDTKVPMTEKETQCTLCSGETIMWLIGRRIDDRFKITETSKRIIRITL